MTQLGSRNVAVAILIKDLESLLDFFLGVCILHLSIDPAHPMSDICPAADIIQSNSALALPCDHGKKLAKVNSTIAITINFIHLKSKKMYEYHVLLINKPLTGHSPFF